MSIVLRMYWPSGSKMSLAGLVAASTVRLLAQWQQNARSLTGLVAVGIVRLQA